MTVVKLNLLLAILFISLSAQAQFFNSETSRKAGEKLVKGDQAGALAILDAAIANGKDLNDAYQMRANTRFAMGDIRGSEADLSSAIQLKPNDPQLYKRRAMFRGFLRDSDGALKDYDSAIAYGLKTDEVFTGRARIKADVGDTDGAITDYRNALAVNSNYASAHLGLAKLYEKKGETDNAILELQQYVDAYESKRDGVLPKTKLGTPNGDPVIIKRDGLEKDGSQVLLTGLPVMTTIKANTPDELASAVRGREQVINTSLIFFDLGRLYDKKDDIDRALLNIDKGLGMSPNDGYGRELRGDIRIKKGDIAGAIEDYKVAVLSPFNGTNIHWKRSILLTLQNDDAAAESEIEAFSMAFPQSRARLEQRVAEAKKLRSQK
jgi:tetratricopeptide (TPR) repeat protein